MSNGEAGSKRIATNKPCATFRDLTGHHTETLGTDEAGEADFPCPAGSVSVWVQT